MSRSLLLALALAVPVAAPAGADPVQFAIWNPVQVVPDDHEITGARLSVFYGKNAAMSGVDVSGVLARTAGDQFGLQLALVGEVGGEMMGWQAGGIALTDGIMRGVQHGVLYNQATEVRGIQISLVNRTKRLTGIQFGLLNFVEDGRIPFMPLINWRF